MEGRFNYIKNMYINKSNKYSELRNDCNDIYEFIVDNLKNDIIEFNLSIDKYVHNIFENDNLIKTAIKIINSNLLDISTKYYEYTDFNRLISSVKNLQKNNNINIIIDSFYELVIAQKKIRNDLYDNIIKNKMNENIVYIKKDHLYDIEESVYYVHNAEDYKNLHQQLNNNKENLLNLYSNPILLTYKTLYANLVFNINMYNHEIF
jgi:hypothetical protein